MKVLLSRITPRVKPALSKSREPTPPYGIIRVRGNGTYNSNEDSFYVELEYIVEDAGSFGTFNETFTITEMYAATPRRTQQTASKKEFKSITLELKSER